MFRPDLVDTGSAEYMEWGERAYAHLHHGLEAIRDAYNPDLDVDDAARLCWSAMQGLVVLYDGMMGREMTHGGEPAPIGDLAASFCRTLLSGLAPKAVTASSRTASDRGSG